MVLLLSIQALPVAAMGYALYQNELSAALPDSDEEPVKLFSSLIDFDKFSVQLFQGYPAHIFLNMVLFYIEFSLKLPLHPLADISTPPPDRA